MLQHLLQLDKPYVYRIPRSFCLWHTKWEARLGISGDQRIWSATASGNTPQLVISNVFFPVQADVELGSKVDPHEFRVPQRWIWHQGLYPRLDVTMKSLLLTVIYGYISVISHQFHHIQSYPTNIPLYLKLVDCIPLYLKFIISHYRDIPLYLIVSSHISPDLRWFLKPLSVSAFRCGEHGH